MKIKTRVSLIYLIPGILLTLSAAGAFYWFSSFNLRAEVFSNLTTAAYSRAAHIDTFLNMMRGRMVDFASDGKIKDCLYALDGGGGISCTAAELSKHLTDNKLPAIEELSEVFAIGTDGVVVAATMPEYVGLDKTQDPNFIFGKESTFIDELHYSDTFDHNIFTVSAPVIRQGEQVGIIVGGITPDALYDILQAEYGLGETGEMYLLNDSNTMLSPSRFEDDVVLQRSVNTVSSRDCFSDYNLYAGENNSVEEHAESLLIFHTYHGAKVVGSHAYVPQMKWCLMAEITDHEALKPIRDLRGFIGIVSGIVILIIYGLSRWMGSKISGPIIKLREGVRVIEQGHLDYKVGTDDEDEFGELSRTFDKMTYSFKKFKDEIDQRVEQQEEHIKKHHSHQEKKDTTAHYED